MTLRDAGDPIDLLRAWIADAGGWERTETIAMPLATATLHARPSLRVVLLRGLDQRGLQFYTSYLSRKGREIEENPFAAALLYWPERGRQVRVEGRVTTLGEDESDAYFRARPRGHQIAAWTSEQSESLESRNILDERFAHLTLRFADEEIARPHSWGGYCLAPDRFEFWQNRPNRMHDRLEYVRNGQSWITRRLQP